MSSLEKREAEGHPSRDSLTPSVFAPRRGTHFLYTLAFDHRYMKVKCIMVLMPGSTISTGVNALGVWAWAQAYPTVRRLYDYLPSISEERGSSSCTQGLDEALLYMANLSLHSEVDDLLQPASELMRNPTIWWPNLGKDDKERTKAFDVLSQARMDWAVFARIAFGEPSVDTILGALDDPDASKLFFIDGPGASDKTWTYTCLFDILIGQGRKVADSVDRNRGQPALIGSHNGVVVQAEYLEHLRDIIPQKADEGRETAC
ncbi:unnamed protein product [Cylicocyclus nassatus]|uniref:Uncharacterized protein n=1 Tax=Cylicocyclus nassatus TaxID=53992 RepID=A0AA36GD34_CYLNA|nr:unnamed protein product [Cylicocyclus nassatus]